MNATIDTQVFANRCSVCTVAATDIVQHTQSAHATFCTAEHARSWGCAYDGCSFTFFDPLSIGLHYLKFHTTLTPFACNHSFIDEMGSRSQCTFASADLAELFMHRDKHAQATQHPHPPHLCRECSQPVLFPDHLYELFSSWIISRRGSLFGIKFTEIQMVTTGSGSAAVHTAANALSMAYSRFGTRLQADSENLSTCLILHPSASPWFLRKEHTTRVGPNPTASTIETAREGPGHCRGALTKFILVQVRRTPSGSTQIRLPRLPELDSPLPANRISHFGQFQHPKQGRVERISTQERGAGTGVTEALEGEAAEPTLRLVPLLELWNTAIQRYGYVPGRHTVRSNLNGNPTTLPASIHGPSGPRPNAG
ncbi:hypothetical protein C8Q78DRAFT_844216 [Trametes maxima]|nr:hypothetical protein C8Q78DRAFT_844216 [Trametes maxima]